MTPGERELLRRIKILERRISGGDGGTPGSHATSHQNGGLDEINVNGLSGVLADSQTVSVAAAGALSGTGASGNPLAVRVDGVTIDIIANELVALGGGSPAVGGGSPEFGSNALMGAMVRKSVDETAANYTVFETPVPFTAEVYDDLGFHNNVTNNSRLTIPAGSGITRINLAASVVCTSATAGDWHRIYFMKNGTATFDGAAGTASSENNTSKLTGLAALGIPCTEGDYFELALQTATDASITVVAARTMFAIQVVGGA